MKTRRKRSAPSTLPIEIFRAGHHKAMGGRTVSFSESDLARIARRYDPAVHEAPIVIGHPKHNAPAYGWVAAVRAKGPSLFAAVDQVNVDFAEGVRAGAYKKVSASFYLPDAPGNPKPGDYYLRHVGFLGAQPPAVKGLAPVEFADSDGDAVTVDFAELDAATLFRSLREWLISEFGLEKADKALPPGLVDWVQEDAAVTDATETADHAEADEATEAAIDAVSDAVTETVVEQCAEATTKAVVDAVTTALVAAFPELDADKVRETVTTALGAPAPAEGESAGESGEASTVIEAALEATLEEALEEPVHAAVEQALAEHPTAAGGGGTVDHAETAPSRRFRDPQLAARERQLARRERQLAARERQAQRQVHASFCEQLSKEGRRLPVSRERMVDLLELVSESEVSFAEGGQRITPVEVLRRTLRRLPKEVRFDEVAAGEISFSEADDPREVGRVAREYIEAQAAKGITVSTSEAVRHVKGMNQ